MKALITLPLVRIKCPFPDETEHGYKSLDTANGYCEVGCGCLEKCPHSWKPGGTTEQLALAAFEQATRL